MGKNKVLVKVHPEGKYVVDLDKSIEMSQARTLTCLASAATGLRLTPQLASHDAAISGRMQARACQALGQASRESLSDTCLGMCRVSARQHGTMAGAYGLCAGMRRTDCESMAPRTGDT